MMCSDVNKDLGLKAKDRCHKANDARPRTSDIKARNLGPKAKDSRSQGQCALAIFEGQR